MNVNLNKGETRRLNITKILKQKQYCSVKDLMNLLNVSEATIKRDLIILEKDKILNRTRGGAYIDSSPTPVHAERLELHKDEKYRIGTYAVSLINDKECIYLDAGSTMITVLNNIKAKNTRIYTNDAYLFVKCITENLNLDIRLVDGKIDLEHKCIFSLETLDHIERLYFDKVFLGASAIEVNSGITSNNYESIMLKKKLIQRGDEIILCADSSKIQEEKRFRSVNFNEIDYFITDEGISESDANKIRSKVKKLIIV